MLRKNAVLGALLAACCLLPTLATQAANTDGPSRLLYIGGRIGGAGQGIQAARFDPRTGALTGLGLAAEVERPTWVIGGAEPTTVFSVSETGNDGKVQAGVYSFSADRATGKLTQVSRVDSGGGGATHMIFDRQTPSLLVANYGTGQVSVVPVGVGGILAPVSSVQADSGSGPHPRQKTPHAHGVILDNTGRYAFVTDLGADRIFIYRFDPATRMLTPSDPAFVAVKPGSGPRHAVLAPNGRFLYVNNELSGEVMTFAWNGKAGTLTLANTLSTLPPGYTGEKSAGEIALAADGRYLYVSNRGEDTIVVYRVDSASGGLSEIQRIASGGKQPWALTADPSGRWLIVANESSDQINVFGLDAKSGKLTPTEQHLSVPHPSSIAILP